MKFEPNIQKSSKNDKKKLKKKPLVEKNTIKHMTTQKERAETIKY